MLDPRLLSRQRCHSFRSSLRQLDLNVLILSDICKTVFFAEILKYAIIRLGDRGCQASYPVIRRIQGAPLLVNVRGVSLNAGAEMVQLSVEIIQSTIDGIL